MAPDAHLEPLYLNLSYKSNNHGCPICQIPEDLIGKVEEVSKSGTATVRQSDSNEILQMKSDTDEDAEKEIKRKKKNSNCAVI